MEGIQGTLKLYQEAFPDNPAFQVQAKRKDKSKKQPAAAEQKPAEAQVAPQQPEVDLS